MGTTIYGRRKRKRHYRVTGFSLIEVMLALGVVVFAMLGIVGLLPVGLAGMRTAMNTTIESQIVQSVSADLQLTDFSNQSPGALTYYYDDQGNKTTNTDPTFVYTATVSAPTGVNAQDPADPTVSPLSISTDSVVGRVVRITNRTASAFSHSFPLYIARTSGNK